MKSSHDRWVKCYRRVPGAVARLCCVGHAGASAAVFRPWVDLLPGTIELCAIELPGRGARRSERPVTRMDQLIDALDDAMTWDRKLPLALFGHSMGALITFELARRLAGGRGREPLHVFVAGHRAPHLRDRASPLHQLPDSLLLDELRLLKGTPPEILEHSELLDLTLPIIRADFELCESYVYRHDAPLNCPISAFGGEEDALVSPDDLEAWRGQTTAEFIARILPGDHFFVYGNPDPVLSSVSQDLARSLAGRTSP